MCQILTSRAGHFQQMNQDPNVEAEINALLADLWQRHLPSTRERLEALGRIASAVSIDDFDELFRAEAQSIAHKLSGNLGMFGHQQAGAIAGEIEQTLKSLTPETVPQLANLVQQLHQVLEPHL